MTLPPNAYRPNERLMLVEGALREVLRDLVLLAPDDGYKHLLSWQHAVDLVGAPDLLGEAAQKTCICSNPAAALSGSHAGHLTECPMYSRRCLTHDTAFIAGCSICRNAMTDIIASEQPCTACDSAVQHGDLGVNADEVRGAIEALAVVEKRLVDRVKEIRDDS